MRPNLLNPPKIEKRDPDLELIEQVDEIYWDPFDEQLRHCFNLSRWHVEFSGTPNIAMELPGYASYETDIFDENSYPRYPSNSLGIHVVNPVKEFWNETTPEIHLRLATLGAGAYIGIGDNQFGHVGSIMIICDIYRVRPKHISGFEKLSKVENLTEYISQHRTRSTWKNAKKIGLLDRIDEIEQHVFNGRTWLRGVTGFSLTDPCNALYTALDDQHLVRVSYSGGFWSQDSNKLSDKSYTVSLTPLWDFMDNFYIEEIDTSDSKQYLTGKVDPKSNQVVTPDEDDNIDGW